MNHLSLKVNGAEILLAGSITIATVPELYNQLQTSLGKTAGFDAIVLDCSQMDAVDSAAIGLLVEIHQQLSAAGKSLNIVGLRDQLVSLIKIYGVDWILAAVTDGTADTAAY